MRWIRVGTLYVKVGDLNVRVQREEGTASPHAWGDLLQVVNEEVESKDLKHKKKRASFEGAMRI